MMYIETHLWENHNFFLLIAFMNTNSIYNYFCRHQPTRDTNPPFFADTNLLETPIPIEFASTKISETPIPYNILFVYSFLLVV